MSNSFASRNANYQRRGLNLELPKEVLDFIDSLEGGSRPSKIKKLLKELAEQHNSNERGQNENKGTTGKASTLR
ncbi:hypothetical protein [Pantoea septica]|uniref:hypothetical protein n=1 Tax=Pantoea septica TaxID=472695 RepID=UPI002898E751|nr:hypothetical protein [Pantoea septica]